MTTQWEVKFKGEFAPHIITAVDFDAAYKLARTLSHKEIVSIQYLCY